MYKWILQHFSKPLNVWLKLVQQLWSPALFWDNQKDIVSYPFKYVGRIWKKRCICINLWVYKSSTEPKFPLYSGTLPSFQLDLFCNLIVLYFALFGTQTGAKVPGLTSVALPWENPFQDDSDVLRTILSLTLWIDIFPIFVICNLY